MRMALEPQANIWAKYRMPDENLTSFHDIQHEIAGLDPGASNKAMVQLDVKLHQLLYRESHNNQINHLLTNLLYHYLRFRLSTAKRIKKEAFFMEAVEERDEARLKATSAAHIKVSLDEIMRSPVG